MAKRQHTIEINGVQYDAVTGAIVTNDSSPLKKSAKVVTKTPSAQFVDGFTKRKQPTSQKSAATSATTVHKKTSRSQTLMRNTVHKPNSPKVHAKSAITQQPTTEYLKPGVKALSADIKPERAARAVTTTKSLFISKFRRDNTPKTVSSVKTGALPVQAAPNSNQQQAADNAKSHAKTIAANKQLDEAIANATSHQQPKIKKPKLHEKIAKRLHIKPATLGAITAGFLIVTIGGYITYDRVPNIAMRFAVARAGVKAQLPSYQPAGFSLNGPIEYTPGQISLAFQSNTDERAFKVIQRASQWNSETLLENFINEGRKQFQTLQANGRTIYIYDGSNATWVDGGVWYQIEGNSSLNSDQLLRIANSL